MTYARRAKSCTRAILSDRPRKKTKKVEHQVRVTCHTCSAMVAVVEKNPRTAKPRADCLKKSGNAEGLCSSEKRCRNRHGVRGAHFVNCHANNVVIHSCIVKNNQCLFVTLAQDCIHALEGDIQAKHYIRPSKSALS